MNRLEEEERELTSYFKRLGIKRHLEGIEFYLVPFGFEIETEYGQTHRSRYWTISKVDDQGDALDEIKVRQSDHPLPPTYGELKGWADFEIGDHVEANGDIVAFLAWIHSRFDIPLTPKLERVLELRNKIEEARLAYFKSSEYKELMVRREEKYKLKERELIEAERIAADMLKEKGLTWNDLSRMSRRRLRLKARDVWRQEQGLLPL